MDSEGNRVNSECNAILRPIGDALYVIGGKWKLRVIGSLRDGGLRFNKIQQAVEGISARVLSAELKELELNGFVKRIVHTASNPVVVEYQLTEYAGTLNEVLMALANWGTMHREKLKNDR
jgi:DNA-binding HxlR family transcriptional regulator